MFEYDYENECWKANNTKAIKRLLKAHNETLENLNSCLQSIYTNEYETPDVFSDNFEMW